MKSFITAIIFLTGSVSAQFGGNPAGGAFNSGYGSGCGSPCSYSGGYGMQPQGSIFGQQGYGGMGNYGGYGSPVNSYSTFANSMYGSPASQYGANSGSYGMNSGPYGPVNAYGLGSPLSPLSGLSNSPSSYGLPGNQYAQSPFGITDPIIAGALSSYNGMNSPFPQLGNARPYANSKKYSPSNDQEMLQINSA
uniref:Uncharacterized protein n=1 Tax=Rhabditophanes sp. KR3021 TaxID=114890 RepID=A0AC35UGV4_9BILA